MSAIRLVVTDLDGTLVDSRDGIAPAALAAVREVQAADDIDLMIATGRRFGSANRVLSRYGVSAPAVLMAGAIGADLGTGVQWHRHPLDPQAGLEALRILREHRLEPVVYVGDADLEAIAAGDCSSNPAHLTQFGPPLRRGEVEGVIADGRCVGLGICGVDHDGLGPAAEALRSVAEPWLGPDHLFGGRTLMISPPGVTKVRGLRVWCEARGITPDQVIAIGDGSNDVAMLEWAGVAVAVHDGVTMDDPHDHAIEGPDTGGWAAIPDLL